MTDKNGLIYQTCVVDFEIGTDMYETKHKKGKLF